MIQELGRLRWACRRGIRELDVLLTRYVDEHFECAPPAEQAAFRELLTQQNAVIYAYCLGQAAPPDEATRILVERVTSLGRGIDNLSVRRLIEWPNVLEVSVNAIPAPKSSNFFAAHGSIASGSPMTIDDSDLKLVEKVQRGERAAFDLLVLRYQHKVLKLIMRYVHDASEAEDIAQEAFVKAYRALPSFRGDSAFYTWLYRIAINTAKNALVASKRRPMDYDLDLQDPEQYELHARLAEAETPEALLLTDEIRDTVNRAIENLPEDLRTAIVLRELEGLSYEDIAETMDCPVGTVRSRIFRAREAIDKKLRPIFDGGLGRPEDT